MSDDSRELTIRMKLDRSHARKATEDHLSDARKMTEATRGAARAQDDAISSSASNQSGAMARFASAFRKATAEAGKDAEALNARIGQATNQLSGFAAGAISIGAATGAMRAFVGVMEQANREAQNQIDKLFATKNSIREIAAMVGNQGGADDAFVQKFLNVRTASGLSDQAAKSFMLEFAGAGEAKKGVNISEQEFEKAKPMIARFAAAKSGGEPGAAGTYGKMAGMLMGFGQDVTADKLLAQQAAFTEILSAGVGDNPTLVQQAMNRAGSMLDQNGTGIVRDPLHLAAMVSTASMANPAQADTMLSQITRVARGFTAKHAPFLDEIGVKPGDDVPGAMRKIFGAMEAAQASGQSPDVFLAEKGIEAMEDRQSVGTFFTNRSYFDKFMGMGAKPLDPEGTKKKLDHAFATQVDLRQNVAEAKLAEAELQNAMPMAEARPLETEARARLVRQGYGPTSATAGWADMFAGWNAAGPSLFTTSMSGQDLGRKFREEQAMAEILAEKGVKSVPGRPEMTNFAGAYTQEYTNWIMSDEYKQTYAQVESTRNLARQVGGRPFGDASTKELESKTDLSNTLLRGILDAFKRPAGPGLPPWLPPGPGNNVGRDGLHPPVGKNAMPDRPTR